MNGKNINQKQNYVELAVEEIEIDEELCIRAKEGYNPHTDERDELNNSVKMYGIMNPIQVIHNPETGKYKLVDGLKRLEAAQKNHPESMIPAIITGQAPVLAYYTLNEIRQNFTVMEKAEAIQNILEEFKPEDLPDNEAAKRIPISPQSLADYKKIASLPEPLKNKARHLKKCTVHQLRRIAGIDKPVEQEKALNDYIKVLYPETNDTEDSKPNYAQIDQKIINAANKIKQQKNEIKREEEQERKRKHALDILLKKEKESLKKINVSFEKLMENCIYKARKHLSSEEARDLINKLKYIFLKNPIYDIASLTNKDWFEGTYEYLIDEQKRSKIISKYNKIIKDEMFNE